MARDIDEVRLFAWVGEDELGSGEVGLKQALVPAGMIPLVAVERGKVDRGPIIAQLQAQADHFGKPIALVEFEHVRILKWIRPAGRG